MIARKGKASGDKVPDFIMEEVLARIATIAQYARAGFPARSLSSCGSRRDG